MNTKNDIKPFYYNIITNQFLYKGTNYFSNTNINTNINIAFGLQYIVVYLSQLVDTDINCFCRKRRATKKGDVDDVDEFEQEDAPNSEDMFITHWPVSPPCIILPFFFLCLLFSLFVPVSSLLLTPFSDSHFSYLF